MKVTTLQALAIIKCLTLGFGATACSPLSGTRTVKPLETFVSQELTANKKTYLLIFSPKRHAALEVTLIASNKEAFGLNEHGTYKTYSNIEITTKVLQNGRLLAEHNVGNTATCGIPRFGSRFYWAPMSTFGDSLLDKAPLWRYQNPIPNGLLEIGKEYTIEVKFVGNLERFLDAFGPCTLAIVRTQHR